MRNMEVDTTGEGNELKISVRLKGKLAEQVIRRTEQEGVYDSKGEYIRDLVRKDMAIERSLDEYLNKIWQQLYPGLLADEKAFKAVSLKEIQKRGRQKAGLIDECNV